MYFTPAETEKLLLSVVAIVARDRLERGILLNHPEAVALLSCWVIEWAREGRGVADLMQEGRTVLNGACHHAPAPFIVEWYLQGVSSVGGVS